MPENRPPDRVPEGWTLFGWWAVIVVIVLIIAFALGWGGRFGLHSDSGLQQQNSRPSILRGPSTRLHTPYLGRPGFSRVATACEGQRVEGHGWEGHGFSRAAQPALFTRL